jgi:carbonic anhydrase/acetyltransferase-like protein (isoleucine patch superfamily)
MNYRPLTEKEIATLTVYGCSAEKWSEVHVAEDFSPSYIANVHFSGRVKLGTYQKTFELDGGLTIHSGVFNCVIHNCTIGNDVYINKINNYIANYEIDDSAFIENVNSIITSGKSTFGNGTRVAVMIEAGGREIPIFEGLSAPLAYIICFYRHNKNAIDSILSQIDLYTASQKSNTGRIGKNAKIVNTDSIKNVRIANYSIIDGAISLSNGSIISTVEAPVYIGKGVECSNFIIQSGSTIAESALVSNCFIGQACLISKQFSAIDSLFFANCQGLHGEAVSIFAGPYTVTHHKATLMLTALYSFMNAGSASNFSNHMYKLGPVHQGITERGVKTSSNSYLMWPAKIGAFTVVIGSHKGNPDISNLPFSYLLENDNESNLLPGINLHSAGTMRDVQKWEKRDERIPGQTIDAINFDFLSPFTIGKVLNGITTLKKLLCEMDDTATFVWYQNCKIKRSSIKKGIELYEMAVHQFLGDILASKIDNIKLCQKTDFTKLFIEHSDKGKGIWVDMTGLLAPKSEVDTLLSSITNKQFTINELQNELDTLHKNYSEYAWNWSMELLENFIEKPLNQITTTEIQTIFDLSKKATLYFNTLILRDAKKEFSSVSKTGFGIDGDDNDKNLDFEAVRGTFENNAFVKNIKHFIP